MLCSYFLPEVIAMRFPQIWSLCILPKTPVIQSTMYNIGFPCSSSSFLCYQLVLDRHIKSFLASKLQCVQTVVQTTCVMRSSEVELLDVTCRRLVAEAAGDL
jgi:hypothetical protein